MSKITRKTRRTLASMLIWVLLFNNTPMLNMLVNAEEDTLITAPDSDSPLDNDSISDNDSVSDNNSASDNDSTSDGDSQEEHSIRELTVEYPADDLFSVSCGDADWESYRYVVEETPAGAVLCGEQWDISACKLPCAFTINKWDANDILVETIKVEIKALPTIIEFNGALKSLGGKFIYGTDTTLDCSASIVSGETESRDIAYTITEGADVAGISPETGLITFNNNKVGKVVVEASVSETDRYAKAEAEFVFEVVIDEAPPQITGNYLGTLVHSQKSDGNLIDDNYEWGSEPDTKLYYDDKVEMTFQITEDNFIKEGVVIKDSYCADSQELSLDWQQEGEGNVWTVAYTIPAAEEGIHQVTIECTDKAGNVSKYISEQIVIRKNKAALKSVNYSEWLDKVSWDTSYNPENYEPGSNPDATLYYNNDMEMIFEIQDENFQLENVKLTDSFKGQNNIIPTSDNVSRGEGNSWFVTYTIPKAELGIHIVSLHYGDNNWYEGDFDWLSEKIEMLDITAPHLEEVVYSGWSSVEKVTDHSKLNVSNKEINDTMRVFSQGDVTLNFVVTEENHDVEDIKLTDEYNGESRIISDLSWTNTDEEPNVWKASYIVSAAEAGEHVLTLTYENEKQEEGIHYTSARICIDKESSKLNKVTYKVETGVDTWESEEVIPNENSANGDGKTRYYGKDIEIVFEITEENFRKGDIQLSDSYYGVLDETKWDSNIDDTNPDKWYICYSIPAEDEGQHTVILKYQDRALNSEISYTADIVMDMTPAILEEEKVVYSEWVNAEDLDSRVILEDTDALSKDNVRLFYGDSMSISFLIVEENFHEEDVHISDSYPKSMEDMNLSFTQDSNDSSKWTVTYNIPYTEEGDHVVTIVYEDKAKNGGVTYTSKHICIDNTDAARGIVTYSEPKYAVNLREETETTENTDAKVYYNNDMSITFRIREENFRKEDVKLIDNYDTAEDIQLNWEEGTGEEEGFWVAVYTIGKEEEGEHVVTLKYQDRATEEPSIHYTSKHIIMDTTPPEAAISYGTPIYENDEGVYYNSEAQISFEITEKNFHKEGVKVTDSLKTVNSSGLKFSQNTEKEDVWIVTYTIPVNKKGEHNVVLYYDDPCANGKIELVSKPIIMDEPTGALQVEYTQWECALDSDNLTELDYYTPDSKDNVKLFYKTDMDIIFRIPEDNFNADYITLTDSYDAAIDAAVLKWEPVDNSNGSIWQATYTIPVDAEGEHVVSLSYNDYLENGDITYVSEKIIMDKTKAELIKTDYSFCEWEEGADTGSGADSIEEHKNRTAYYKDTVVLTFGIKETNFYKNKVVVKDSYDTNGKNIELDWQLGTGENAGLWIAKYEIPKEQEGVHVLTLSYQDYSNNEKLEYTSKTIIIDTIAAKEGEILYSEWVNAENLDTGDKVSKEEAELSNNFKVYYKDVINDDSDNYVDITFHIIERNFHPAGVIIMDNHDGEEKGVVLDWQPGNAEDTWCATYSIPKTEAGEHIVSLTYQDRCKNGERINYTSKHIIIDTEAAALDSKTYEENWVSVRRADTGAVVSDYEAGTGSDVCLYYNKGTEITFKIKERYFHEEDVIFTDSFDTSRNNAVLEWKSVEGEEDMWIATYSIPDTEEGEHIITLDYQDRSANTPAIHYVSEHMIIDHTAAELKVPDYTAWNIAEEISTGKMVEDYAVDSKDDVKLYYNTDMEITFVITEANFYKEDVVLMDTCNGMKDKKIVDWVPGTEENTWVGTYSIPVSEAGEHIVTLTYKDSCSNEPAINYTSEHIIIDKGDSILSRLEYDEWVTAEDITTLEKLYNHNIGSNFNNVRLYYKDDMEIAFEITEENFHKEDVILKDSYDTTGKNIELDWQQGTGTNSNKWTATYTIPKKEEGEHILTLSYKDRSGNQGIYYTSERIMIDTTPASLSVVNFTGWLSAVASKDFTNLPDYEVGQREDVNLYYADSMAMTFMIEEANFNAEDVVFKDCYYEEQPPVDLKWVQGKDGAENQYTLIYPIRKEDEGVHVITLYYQERSENIPIEYTSETIIIDNTKPEISLDYKEELEPHRVDQEGVAYYGENQTARICIKEDNFRASEVEITMLIEDAVEEVDVEAIKAYLKDNSNWTRSPEGNVTTVDLTKDAKYDIKINYTDLAYHDAEEYSTKIAVDKISPVAAELETDVAYDTDSCMRMVDDENNVVLTADAKTRFIYNDAMTFTFAMEEINFNAEDVIISVYRDGELLINGDGYSYEYGRNWESKGAAPYIHTLTLELGKKDGALVDGDYQVKVDYTDLAGHSLKTYTSNIMSIDHTKPSIGIAYDNMEVNNDSYYNRDRVATITIKDRNVVPDEVEVDIEAVDIEGNVITFDAASKKSPWIAGEEPYTWVSKITYDVDAEYDFRISCTDMATNNMLADDSFTVDKTAPSTESFQFEYSSPVKDSWESDVNNVFYKDQVTIKITAEDIISPIEYFEWTYIKQPGASLVNQEAETHIIRWDDDKFVYDEKKRTATAEFTLTAEQARQYCGNIRFKATDMAGNTSEELTDAERIVVVDTISPTRSAVYSPANQIVNKNNLNTLSGFDYASENVGAVLLYSAPMSVTFKVNEANFYKEDIVVKVNDVEKEVANWSKAGDVWTGSLSIAENGEYVVTLEYMDRSSNEMVDYVSHQIIIDTVKPRIHINYGPNDVKQEVDGIKYYDKQQTATITITERNFRAEDIEVVVSAKDINGNDIDVTDFDSYLKNRSSWVKKEDNYTANITFAADANYEFDIAYKDLALIPADDYPKNVFTVDQTAPTNVSVSYSSPIFEKTAQGTAFAFYNEPIMVTITAEDDISGVYSFDYGYIRAEGVSSVNSENVNSKIEASRITYSNGRKTATATFIIPSSELRSGNQINGTMEYVANNRSLLKEEIKDPKRFVVDNIVPNVKVEFSDCIQKVNNISYYAGDIDVTITIDEANFYADDVKVSIAKDGGVQTPADVNWRNLSVDEHVGTFTLHEEGDYRVYVSYQDSSTNKVDEYQSNQLTIDTIQPTVTVSGIKNMSANKQELIGFVVKVEDTNLDINSLSPQLLAEIRDEAGVIQQVDCTELGTVESVVKGKSCTYTITNIEEDGIYSFSCSVSDMSGNMTEDMVIEDSENKTVSVLEYSVNRNGSVYGLDDSTKELNNSFVKQAIDVVIYEVNPDELSNLKITLFKNDKTIVLEEGKDYIITLLSEEGDWYKYQYTIYATNFMEDGTYRISVYSEDKAGNIAENTLDVKNMEINFGIDKTLPNLVVTNLESNTTYPLDKLSVLMQATDNMKLTSIKVQLDGYEVANWDEEQIQQLGSNFKDFVFDIMGNETKAHTIVITLTDIAGNQRIETITDFYVTTNLWVRYINNKVLFYGSIGACVIAGASFILLWKRRKKRKASR